MITLKDIAATVGVSPSAVSLVINDRHEGRINAETAQRIRTAVREMGYIPNQLARGLKTKRTHTIGILSDRVASAPFAGHMLEGVQTAAWDAGYLGMVIDTTDRPELMEQSVRSLLQRDIDGLIVAAEYHRQVTLPPIPPTIPLIVLDGVPHGASHADSVVPDEAGGAYAATSHLLEKGHRRIAFCNVGGERFVASRLRYEGYARALREHEAQVDPHHVIELEDTATAEAYRPLQKLLSRKDRPTAIFCFSDQIAFAAYQAADALDLRIPQDLSIIGFDDQRFIADALRPALTTVRLPHYEMGAWAAQRLISRLHGEIKRPPSATRIPCPLIVRGSAGPPSP